jgi:transcriptional regulator with XRE-family HTH domain
MPTFAEKMVLLIGRTGLSQAQLAKASGVTQSAISDMTRGIRRPYLDQGLALARALGVPLDFLADDELAEPPPPPSEREEAILGIVRARERVEGKATLSIEEIAWRLSGPVVRADLTAKVPPRD